MLEVESSISILSVDVNKKAESVVKVNNNNKYISDEDFNEVLNEVERKMKIN